MSKKPRKSSKSASFSSSLQLGRAVEWPTTPDAAKLDGVPNPQRDTNYVVRFTAPEFTSICPVTGQPDFAHLVIDYGVQRHPDAVVHRTDRHFSALNASIGSSFDARCALNPKTVRFGRGEGENCSKQNDRYDGNCGKH